MATRRFKSATMKFGVPLAVPGSLYVERCYGKHGKGYAHTPPRHSDLELVLVNESRQLWYTPGRYEDGHAYLTDAPKRAAGESLAGVWPTDRCRSASTTRSIPNSRRSTTCRSLSACRSKLQRLVDHHLGNRVTLSPQKIKGKNAS